MYFTPEGYYKGRLEVSVAFKRFVWVFLITKSALTTKRFCIIVSSSVNFEGKLFGGGKHSHANGTVVQSKK